MLYAAELMEMLPPGHRQQLSALRICRQAGRVITGVRSGAEEGLLKLPSALKAEGGAKSSAVSNFSYTDNMVFLTGIRPE